MAERSAKPQKRGCSAREIAEELMEVRHLLNLGKNNPQICRILSDKYGLQERTAYRRIADARKQQVAELEQLDRRELAAQLINAAQEILDEARTTRQLSNALGALGFISRMTGIEVPRN